MKQIYSIFALIAGLITVNSASFGDTTYYLSNNIIFDVG